jgi:heme/copper-type cytochrome/quinol oxidase subunit 4
MIVIWCALRVVSNAKFSSKMGVGAVVLLAIIQALVLRSFCAPIFVDVTILF